MGLKLTGMKSIPWLKIFLAVLAFLLEMFAVLMVCFVIRFEHLLRLFLPLFFVGLMFVNLKLIVGLTWKKTLIPGLLILLSLAAAYFLSAYLLKIECPDYSDKNQPAAAGSSFRGNSRRTRSTGAGKIFQQLIPG